MIRDFDLDPIDHVQYLTDEECESDEENYMNFYKFICAQSQRNKELRNYLWDTGFYDPEDLEVLDSLPDIPQEIYDLLDISGKRTMKYHYLYEVRKLIKIPNFTFVEHR
jgi:hypothetical protein